MRAIAELVADLDSAVVGNHRDHASNRRQILDQLRVRGRTLEAFRIFVGDEVRREIALAETRVLHQRGQEIDIVADAVDHELVERGDLRVDRFPPASAPR